MSAQLIEGELRRANVSQRIPWIVPVIALGFLASLVVSCADSDDGAASELSRAVAEMAQAQNYSFRSEITTDGGTVVLDGRFEAPDRIEQTVRGPGAPAVAVLIDGVSMFILDPVSGRWVAAPPSAVDAIDLRTTFDTIEPSGRVTRDGDTFSFTLSDDAARQLAGEGTDGSVEVRVTTAPGGLSRLEYSLTKGGIPVAVVIEYDQIGTTPSITLPA